MGQRYRDEKAMFKKRKRKAKNISSSCNKGEETGRTEIPVVFAEDRLYLTAEQAKFKGRQPGMDREQDKRQD